MIDSLYACAKMILWLQLDELDPGSCCSLSVSCYVACRTNLTRPHAQSIPGSLRLDLPQEECSRKRGFESDT